MKLYTEEQVRKMLDLARFTYNSEDKILLSQIPIELPSDLTLSDWKQAKEEYEHEMCLFADEYASYILDQSKLEIKGAMVSMCAWTFFKNRRNEQQ